MCPVENVLLMGTRWVLAIIEDYMMVEYVDLPKGSDTWPFLKRWWIVVARLTENIICWFLIEFLLYTSIVWWTITYWWEVYDKSPMFNFVAAIIINMMLLCPYFVFIDTSLSKHVDMFFDFGFCSDPTSDGQISVYKCHTWSGNADTHSTWRIYNRVQSHTYYIECLKRELITIIWLRSI